MLLPFCLSQPGDPEKITERSRIHILPSTDSSITLLVFQLPEGVRVDLCLPSPAHHSSSYLLRSRVIPSLFQIVKRSSTLAPRDAPLIHSRWEKTTDECTPNVTWSPPGRGELSLRGAGAPENHISTLNSPQGDGWTEGNCLILSAALAHLHASSCILPIIFLQS